MNKPQLGGIFSIVSGAIGALMGLVILAVPVFMTVVFNTENVKDTGPALAFMWIFYGAFSFFHMALGALAIVGGVFTLKKVRWGWALAGAIAASLSFYYTGIVAVIFVAMSQAEFTKAAPAGGARP